MLGVSDTRDGPKILLSSLVLRRLQPDANVFERVGFLELYPMLAYDGATDPWPAEKTVVEIV
jgi:hypothetical protein